MNGTYLNQLDELIDTSKNNNFLVVYILKPFCKIEFFYIRFSCTQSTVSLRKPVEEFLAAGKFV